MNPALWSAAAGLALALTSVPFAWSWLAPLPLAVLFHEVSQARSRRAAFLLGLVAGTAFFAVHLAWLFTSFIRLFGPAGGAVTLLVVPLLALSWGLAAFLARTRSPLRTLIVLPFAWLLSEYARTLGPLAFPWGALGYAFLPTPLVQVADLGGVSLVSLLVTLAAAGLAAAAQGHRVLPSCVLALLGLVATYGFTRPEPAPPDRTALLVQGAVPPLQKAAERDPSEWERYLTLTRRGLRNGAVDLIVWPESASPFPPTQPHVGAALGALGVPVVMGAPSGEGSMYWNSAYAYDRGVTGRYDKVHPVPFGEFFPWRQTLAFAYDPMLRALGLPGLLGVTPGATYASLPLRRDQVGAYISYESVFPQAARQLTLDGARVLTHLSNDAWFDGTSGKEQHFQMGRLRAIETRRYVLRASNNGISGAIDPRGQVQLRFPEGVRATFRAPFKSSSVITPYVRWGDWPVVFAAFSWAVLAFVRWPY